MPALDPGRRALVRLSALLGAGELDELPAALDEAAAAPAGAIEEALLQAYLFVGFPSVLRAFGEWRKRGGPGRTQPARQGEAAPPARIERHEECDAGRAGRAEPPAERDADRAEWARRGEALCRRIYGPAYPQLRRNVQRLHPALDRWMVEEGYGKVLGRPGLEPAARELCIVALLAAAGHGPQLHSHLRGALRVGAAPTEVEEALEAGAERAGGGAAAMARALWARVREKGGADLWEAPEAETETERRTEADDRFTSG